MTSSSFQLQKSQRSGKWLNVNKVIQESRFVRIWGGGIRMDYSGGQTSVSVRDNLSAQKKKTNENVQGVAEVWCICH